MNWQKCLSISQYQFDYLDALITQQSSETDAYAKFDALATDRLTELRKMHLKLQVKIE
jgi:hypothetical protein